MENHDGHVLYVCFIAAGQGAVAVVPGDRVAAAAAPLANVLVPIFP